MAEPAVLNPLAAVQRLRRELAEERQGRRHAEAELVLTRRALLELHGFVSDHLETPAPPDERDRNGRPDHPELWPPFPVESYLTDPGAIVAARRAARLATWRRRPGPLP
jgi:hypothetical protein